MSRNHWLANEEAQIALFERNDPNIDIALVRIATDPKLIEIIINKYEIFDNFKDIDNKNRNFISKLILSAIQNKQSLSWCDNPNDWLYPAWDWILEYGDREHYNKLFSNSNVPSELITNVLNGSYDKKTNEKFCLYESVLKSPVLIRGKGDERSGPNLAAREPIQTYWEFLAKVDINDIQIVTAVIYNIENIPRVLNFDEKKFNLPNYGSPNYNRDANLIAYFEILKDNWLKKSIVEDDYYNSWQCSLVEYVASRLTDYKIDTELNNYLKNNDLITIRKGFYRRFSFGNEHIMECENFATKDGYEFLSSAIYNDSFYNFRDDKNLCFWFFKKISLARRDKSLPGRYDESFKMDEIYKFRLNKIFEREKSRASFEAISFDDFEKLYDEWMDSDLGPENGIFYVQNRKNIAPQLPICDIKNRVSLEIEIDEFKLNFSNKSNKYAQSFLNVEMDGVINEKSVQKFNSTIKTTDSDLTKIEIKYGHIKFEEFEKTEDQYPRVSFRGEYSQRSRSIFFTILCTSDQIQSACHLMKLDISSKLFLKIVILPDQVEEKQETELQEPTGKIIDWELEIKYIRTS